MRLQTNWHCASPQWISGNYATDHQIVSNAKNKKVFVIESARATTNIFSANMISSIH